MSDKLKDNVVRFAGRTPSVASLFLIGCAIVFGTLFLGPLRWEIYGDWALWYLLLVFLVFYLGLRVGKHIYFASGKVSKGISVCVSQHKVRSLVLFLSAIALLSAVFLTVHLVISNRLLLSETDISESESVKPVEQILNVLTQLGVASFLLAEVNCVPLKRSGNALVFAGFCGMAFCNLIQGSRFTTAAYFFIYLFAKLRKRKKIKRGIGEIRLREIGVLLLVIAVAAVLLAVFVGMMDARGIIAPTNWSVAVTGDVRIREPWATFYGSSGGFSKTVMDAIFNFFAYLGQAPAYFCYFVTNYAPDSPYWFSQIGRIVQKLTSVVGVNLIAAQGQYAIDLGGSFNRYSTFVWSLIIDFGIYLAPFAAFVFGLLFSKIEQYKESNILCGMLYPCVATVCLFAPVYYFYIGRMDWIVFDCMVVYALARVFGLFNENKKAEIHSPTIPPTRLRQRQIRDV
ncbi:hypothetical protein [Adlercreutzia sp. ZJ138]|uniref:hypothetical protein n=1 Tax=Adlercreutzia sp. ZJ138 TaxID=2709405 RepID=UPI0013EB1D2F|nr:hypothetical protein [Adlercreutzia sp. ZJ138]